MRTHRFFFAITHGTAAVALCLIGSGCTSSKSERIGTPTPSHRQEAGEVFSSGTHQGSSGASQTWAIALALVPVDDEPAAQRMIADIRTRAGLTDARLERRGKAFVAAYGNYNSPQDAHARADLARLREKFPGAMLMPPEAPGWTPSNPEYDLGTVRSRLGKWARYTLQVAVYERSDGRDPTPEELAEIRRAAEQAAARLRADGDEAYFYHSARRSMVTVGVFAEKDIRTGPMSGESPALQALRAKYPYNLVNGATIKVKTRANPQGAIQSSFVVAIPD
jgi:hypothetical protein